MLHRRKTKPAKSTLTCLRCGHTWVPRVEIVKTCPKCRSSYWDTPRKRNRS